MAGEKTRFKAGVSGNPKGRPRRTLFDGDLRTALKRNRGARSKELVAALIGKALTGDVGALKLIAERVGGKAKPAEVTPPAELLAELTREQAQQRLAELLSHPDVKKDVERILFTQSKGTELKQ